MNNKSVKCGEVVWCLSLLQYFIQRSLRSSSAQVHILLVACRRLARVRITNNDPSWKKAKHISLVNHSTQKKNIIIIIIVIIRFFRNTTLNIKYFIVASGEVFVSFSSFKTSMLNFAPLTRFNIEPDIRFLSFAWFYSLFSSPGMILMDVSTDLLKSLSSVGLSKLQKLFVIS